ncbi:dihydroorotase [bacterium]|nr:dihydroorotase [bacterium]
MQPVVIEGGHVIDAATNLDGKFDVLISGGVVEAIEAPGAFRSASDIRRVDATGKWVIPGCVDLHVHLREPGEEWKETIQTGAEAAVLGGYTSICCMPNTKPANDSAETTRYILEKARAAGAARVLPIGAVSMERKGKNLAPCSELAKAGCVAFSDDGDPVADAGLMRRALEWCLMLGLPIACHEEDRNLSCGGCMNESPLSLRMGLKGFPGVAEDVMIARDIELARFTKGKVHICHVSTARGVELIRRAKHDGIAITCEVAPHHLMLNEESVAGYDTNCKMMPPLKASEDVKGLFAGLADGTIDAIASDHAPHDRDSKQVEFSRATVGILGLQTSLPLAVEMCLAGAISRARMVDLLCSGPARAFGLPYGTIRPGSAADVVVLDPRREWVFAEESIRSKSKNSPFIGRKLTGATEHVFVGGKHVVSGGRLVAEAGQ